MEVLPLTETVAKEIGGHLGPIGCRHAAWEARRLSWPILSWVPGLYAADGVPVLKV